MPVEHVPSYPELTTTRAKQDQNLFGPPDISESSSNSDLAGQAPAVVDFCRDKEPPEARNFNYVQQATRKL